MVAYNKKLKFTGNGQEKNRGYIDGDLVSSIESLWKIQDELDKINEEASDRVLEMKQKYDEIRKPVFHKRDVIIQSIRYFWLSVFLGHPVLGDLLTEKDQEIFKYLSSLEVEDFKGLKSGYSITFKFDPNPYFEDTKLTKTIIYFNEGKVKITATSIMWKEGMGIYEKKDTEKNGNKRSMSDGSFFTWFNDVLLRNILDENDVQDEIGEMIKDELWPNPLTYLNNEPDQEEYDLEDSNEEGKEASDRENNEEYVYDEDAHNEDEEEYVYNEDAFNEEDEEEYVYNEDEEDVYDEDEGHNKHEDEGEVVDEGHKRIQ